MNADLNDFMGTLTPEQENKVKKRLNRTRRKVELILEDKEEARNNDKILIDEYCFLSTGKRIPKEILDIVGSFESITRCRRKIQEEGLFLPNQETAEARYEEEQGYVEFSKQ